MNDLKTVKKLLPCPFCGYQLVQVWKERLRPFNGDFYVCCERIGCGAKTSYCKTHDIAVSAWNTRATLDRIIETPAPTEKVDVESLKRVHPIRDRANGIYSSASHHVDGWNACIDHLANTGRLR